MPKYLKDHTNARPTDNTTHIDQQYADDIGWISNTKHNIDQAPSIHPKPKQRNLQIDALKTELYCVTRNGDETWKKCKYLGTLLETEDIKR